MPPRKPPRTIVVHTPNWLGDHILAYPFFHYLRRGYPEARITAVCRPWVAAVQFRHLVDAVCVVPQPANASLWARLRALEQGAQLLRAGGPWELGICLPNSFAAAWLLTRAQVQWRRGYAAEGRSWLLHDCLPWSTQASRHRAEAYVHLLPEPVRPHGAVLDFWQALAQETAGAEGGCQHARGVLAQFDAARAWSGDTPCAPPAEAYWVLAPGSMAASRRWPLAQYAALARQIARTTGMRGLVVGGAAEAVAAQRLCADPELRLTDWTARGTVAAYWKVFRQARFTVSNDSGLAHVAALCGCPVYIVWGAGNPRTTRPLGPGPVHILHHAVPCWPCERNVCDQPPAQSMACLRGIPVHAVWQEIQRL